jgi:hypothetical protein
MDLKGIKLLLEKYYSGESTLEEENTLREYFNTKDVDNELLADKDIFLYQSQENTENIDVPDISDQIWGNIKDIENGKARTLNPKRYLFLRIAASIVVLLGSYFLLKNDIFNGEQEIQFTDTYEDPEVAYQQAKETLMYVSAMLNNGTDHLEPIHKVNEGTEQLNKLSSFNEGLKELNPVRKFKVADKYIKQ